MKLVLIDRDGVINVELDGYVTHPSELRIMPEALKAFALFKQAGFICVVITNQSVVGRGIITLEQLEDIHNYLREELAKHGGEIADVFACTDHPDQATSRRKPGDAMLREALAEYGATPEDTAFIGDAITDMQAAFSVNCQRYLVMTGKGEKTKAKIPDEMQPVILCETILEAAQMIIAKTEQAEKAASRV